MLNGCNRTRAKNMPIYMMWKSEHRYAWPNNKENEIKWKEVIKKKEVKKVLLLLLLLLSSLPTSSQLSSPSKLHRILTHSLSLFLFPCKTSCLFSSLILNANCICCHHHTSHVLLFYFHNSFHFYVPPKKKQQLHLNAHMKDRKKTIRKFYSNSSISF